MNFFKELSQRRVFTTAAIYIPAAWLAAEILLAIFDRFDTPQWAGDVVVMLFLLGFPVALLLSWLFDVTNHGIKRTSPGTPLGIVTLLASGLFLSVGAYISYQVFSGRLDEVRVAILPLKASALNEEAQPYAAGIADGVRNTLRQISLFRVPAQTSSEAVIQAGLDIPGIAARLGVDYIVEGTLTMVGDNLHVAVSLLNDDGDTLWSERYERATRDLFDLQNDLVRAVAMNLGMPESDPGLQAQMRKPAPTTDMEAHRLYLQGKSLPVTGPEAEQGNLRMEAFKAARARDPGYAAVYSAMALEYSLACWGMDDRNNPSCEMAINFAKQGLEIDPGMGDAVAVLAMVHSIRYEWQDAQNAIDRFNDMSSSSVVSMALPSANVNLGRAQQAWDAGIRFYENDPLNFFSVGLLSQWASLLLKDQQLTDFYDALAAELMPVSILAGDPWIRQHRISQEQAIEDGRMVNMMFGVMPELADVLVPAVYDPSLVEGAAVQFDLWLSEGQLRPTMYWAHLPYLDRHDQFVEMAFGLYDQKLLNPVMLWIEFPGVGKIRSHPRYIELLEYIGIAEYWDKYGWPAFCSLDQGERTCGPGASAKANG
jgi:TolB-like protein